jgi:fatty-acyl-CoA synthase
VIGVPEARYGEEVMALREFCAGQLAHCKIPRYLKLVDAFPMTLTGKVRKTEMREDSIAELGLADAAATQTA